MVSTDSLYAPQARFAFISLLIYVGFSSPAGICLCDYAEVGLRQVPGGRGAGRGAVGGLVGGSRTGSLLPAWALI